MSTPMYSGWTMPRKEGLFGLTTSMTFAFLALVIVSIVVMGVGGLVPGVVFTALWVVGVIPLLMRYDGRTVYEMVVTRVQFAFLKRQGKTRYVSGPFSRVPGGRYRLPGVLSRTKMREYTSAGGRRFGIIHDPAKAYYTIIFRVWAQGDEAVDQNVIDDHIYHWGSYLAFLGQEGDVVGATAVVETIPATGNRVRNEVAQITRREAPALAQQVMVEAAQIQSRGRIEVESRLALTFKATTTERRKNWEDEAVVIAQRLPALAANLATAGLVVREMTPEEIIAYTRRAYDPSCQVDLERAGFTAQSHGVEWEDAGPAAAEQTPIYYKHDGAVSATWEMMEPPRGSVSDRILRPLLAPNEDVPYKRVAICYRPHTASAAAKIVDEDYSDALTAVRGSRKETASARMLNRVAATEQARQEEARGHGVSRFGILITITEPNEKEMPNAEAVMKSLSQQARLRIRRRYASQQISFAASLGVGVHLPENLTAAGMIQQ